MRKFRFTPNLAVCTLALLFNIALSLNALAATELYRWTDENGVQHFSQQPPTHLPTLESVDINGQPLVSGDTPEVATTTTEPETEPAEKQIERVENPEKDAQHCEIARRNIAQIEQYRRVRAKDPETGELKYLNDDEKASQLKNWQDRQNTYC